MSGIAQTRTRFALQQHLTILDSPIWKCVEGGHR